MEERKKGAKTWKLAAGVKTRTESKASPTGSPHVLRAWRLNLAWTPTPQATLPPQADARVLLSWRKQCGSCEPLLVTGPFPELRCRLTVSADGSSSRKDLSLVGIASNCNLIHKQSRQTGLGAEGGYLCPRKAGRMTNDPGVARSGKFPRL